MRKFFFTYMPASLLLVFLAMILWTCGGGGGVGGGTPDMAFPADVAPDVVIPPTATIGSNPVIGTGTIIDKWVTIGDDCEIGDGVTLKKYVTAGDNFKVGNNTVINQYVSIGDDVELGEDLVIDRNVVIGSNVTIGNATVIGQYANIGDDVTIGEGVRMGKNVIVESGVLIPDFADISANTTVPIVFTTEMLAGKVFVPIQPEWQHDDVTIVQFSEGGTVLMYNWSPWVIPNFQLNTWSWSIDGNGRLFNDFPEPMPDVYLTLISDTPTYQDWVYEDGTPVDRMRKVIPFNQATLPGAYTIEAPGTGTITFVAGGTGSHTQNGGTDNFTWSVDTEGVLILTLPDKLPVERDTIYLLAGSTTTNLNIAGITYQNGTPHDVYAITLIRQ